MFWLVGVSGTSVDFSEFVCGVVVWAKKCRPTSKKDVTLRPTKNFESHPITILGQ